MYNKYFNKAIAIVYYALFLLVPLAFTSANSELFELNKMWITWIGTILVVCLWATKSLLSKKVYFARTPFDIPIAIFFASQVLATIFTYDHHVSLWGYYSRFNGGLYSTIAYIILYYGFASNLNLKHLKRLIYTSLISAFIVSIWGFPSHYGYDPTCYIVRGTFDISCWTDQFVPTVRVFSTLGQPAWLSAYLAVIIFITMALVVKNFLFGTGSDPDKKSIFTNFKSAPLLNSSLIIGLLVFYILLIFSNTRAGFLGFFAGFIIFWGILLLSNFKKHIKVFLLISGLFLLCNVFFGMPINQLRFITIDSKIQAVFLEKQKPQESIPAKTDDKPKDTNAPKAEEAPNPFTISDSGNIRKNVWIGAINAWKQNPIFGTGVETYAFAYYKYKPESQNLTSEWDYLYNKAHNEYLNYLATTGIVGLMSVLILIGYFYFYSGKWFYKSGRDMLAHPYKENQLPLTNTYLIIGFTSAMTTILVTNFFGFSVVIINLFFFLIPIFVYMLIKNKKLLEKTDLQDQSTGYKTITYVLIIVVWIMGIYLIYFLGKFWVADRSYALGYNLDRVGQYQDAYPKLLSATTAVPSEPTFKDELSYNLAILSVAYFNQGDQNTARTLMNQSLTLSNELINTYPNNIVILKNRVRTLTELSKIDPQYYGLALQTIVAAQQFAPNDAKIAYNTGVILGQTGQVAQGIQVLERATRLRPFFRDAYFALGLFYRDMATESSNTVKHEDLEKKAEDNLNYILKNIDSSDDQAKETLASWGVL